MKIYADFSIPYEKQTKEIKTMFCKYDYEEVKSLLRFRNRMRKIKKIIDTTIRV